MIRESDSLCEGVGREHKQEDEGEEGAEEGMKRMCNPCTFLPPRAAVEYWSKDRVDLVK